MAFPFAGTFTSAQFSELAAFSNIQANDIQNRVTWLSAELQKVGVFKTVYDGPTPVSFSCNPSTSYGAKLLQAYRILGGTPETDMLLRTSDQPTFLTRGTNISSDPMDETSGYSDVYSNGRRHRGSQRFDRDVCIQVDILKKWQLEAIKHKRERLEFKIKRALDFSDQLQNEINTLNGLLTASGSVQTLIDNVLQVATAPGANNYIENSDDAFGLNIGRVGDTSSQLDAQIQQDDALRVNT